jgi:hypothetical protein
MAMAGRGEARLKGVLERVNEEITMYTELLGDEHRGVVMDAGTIKGLVVARDLIQTDLKAGGETDGE